MFLFLSDRIYSDYVVSHCCRRFKEKKEAVEPEADPERDQRTVFAYQVDDLTFSLKSARTKSCLIDTRLLLHNFLNLFV